MSNFQTPFPVYWTLQDLCDATGGDVPVLSASTPPHQQQQEFSPSPTAAGGGGGLGAVLAAVLGASVRCAVQLRHHAVTKADAQAEKKKKQKKQQQQSEKKKKETPVSTDTTSPPTTTAAATTSTTTTNAFGDEVLSVDLLCDDIIAQALRRPGSGVAAFASEERPTLEYTEAFYTSLYHRLHSQHQPLQEESLRKELLDRQQTQPPPTCNPSRSSSSPCPPPLPSSSLFTVAYDPLDGSSIVDCNFAVGSIFGIWPASNTNNETASTMTTNPNLTTSNAKAEADLVGKRAGDLAASVIVVYGPRTTAFVAVADGFRNASVDGYSTNSKNNSGSSITANASVSPPLSKSSLHATCPFRQRCGGVYEFLLDTDTVVENATTTSAAASRSANEMGCPWQRSALRSRLIAHFHPDYLLSPQPQQPQPQPHSQSSEGDETRAECERQRESSYDRKVIAAKAKIFSPGNLRAAMAVPWYRSLITEYYMGRGITLRYTGGMVPDVAQIFVKGSGIFMTPKTPTAKVKLRVCFECAPIALLMEAGGGAAVDGDVAGAVQKLAASATAAATSTTTTSIPGNNTQTLLDRLSYRHTVITAIDQRSAFTCGSRDDVQRYVEACMGACGAPPATATATSSKL